MANYGLLGLMRGYTQGNNVLRAQGIQEAQRAEEQQTRGLQDQLLQQKINADAANQPFQNQLLQSEAQDAQTRANVGLQTAPYAVQTAQSNASKASADAKTANFDANHLADEYAQKQRLIQSQMNEADADAALRQKQATAEALNLNGTEAKRTGSAMGAYWEAVQNGASPADALGVYNQLVPSQYRAKNITLGAPNPSDPAAQTLTVTGPKGTRTTTIGGWLSQAHALSGPDPVGIAPRGASTYDKRTGKIIAGGIEAQPLTTPKDIQGTVYTANGGSQMVGLGQNAQKAVSQTAALDALNQATGGKYTAAQLMDVYNRVTNNGASDGSSRAAIQAMAAQAQQLYGSGATSSIPFYAAPPQPGSIQVGQTIRTKTGLWTKVPTGWKSAGQ